MEIEGGGKKEMSLSSFIYSAELDQIIAKR